MYPWAVAYNELNKFGLAEMGVFVALLMSAYVYVWKKGALEWAE
jgi:NADH-quinone oxidoreductase subunit A